MPLSLSTVDGEEVPIEDSGTPEHVADAAALFEKAKDGTLTADEARRPPRKSVDTTDPGYTPNPEPKKRGRPRKEDAARTTSKAPAPQEPLKPKDFTGDLNALLDGIWLGSSQIPVAAPYAAVIHANQQGLVHAINQGAQVNSGVRNFCEKMTSGAGNAWVLELAVVGMNIGMQMYSVYQNPELRTAVVEANATQVKAYVDAIAQVTPVG